MLNSLIVHQKWKKDHPNRIFAIFDIETTGTKYSTSIVQIGCIIESEIFCEFIKPSEIFETSKEIF